jgi:hypothetical protein
MPREKRVFDLEGRLIDFAVRIIHMAESTPKTRVGSCSIFDIYLDSSGALLWKRKRDL